MRIEVLTRAREDMAAAREFYERQSRGAGDYFAIMLAADIEALIRHAGSHRMFGAFHRALASRFPFGIFYNIEAGTVRIYAVLDLRRHPTWIRRRLRRDG